MPAQEPNGLLLFALCFAGALGLIGLLKLNHWWATRADRVKHYQPVMSPPAMTPLVQTTDRPADRLSVSATIENTPRHQVDRTREAVIEELLYSGWTMTDLRREGILRGDNTKISAEVEAARKRLGIETAELRTPIAGRPTDARFASDLQETA